jgi:hypothetical protein
MDRTFRRALCALAALAAASLPGVAVALPEAPTATGPVLQLALPIFTEWSMGATGPFPSATRPVFIGARLRNATVGVGLGLSIAHDDQEEIGFGESRQLAVDVGPSVAFALWRAHGTEAYVVVAMPLRYSRSIFGNPENEWTYLAAGASAGLGGTHFLSRHFGLGAEAAVSGLFVFGRYMTGDWVSTGWGLALHGAVTATLVL